MAKSKNKKNTQKRVEENNETKYQEQNEDIHQIQNEQIDNQEANMNFYIEQIKLDQILAEDNQQQEIIQQNENLDLIQNNKIQSEIQIQKIENEQNQQCDSLKSQLFIEQQLQNNDNYAEQQLDPAPQYNQNHTQQSNQINQFSQIENAKILQSEIKIEQIDEQNDSFMKQDEIIDKNEQLDNNSKDNIKDEITDQQNQTSYDQKDDDNQQNEIDSNDDYENQIHLSNKQNYQDDEINNIGSQLKELNLQNNNLKVTFQKNDDLNSSNVSGKNSVLENKEYKDLIIKRFKNEVEMREKFQKQSFDNFSLQQKAESFRVIDNWNTARLQFLQDHQNIIEQIVKNIKVNKELSENGFKSVISFFQDRLKAEIANLNNSYCTFQLSGYCKKNSVYKNDQLDQSNPVYPKLSKFLQEADFIHQNRYTEMQLFTQTLKDLIDNLLLKEEKIFEDGVSELISSLKSASLQMQKVDKQHQICQKQYKQIFQEVMTFSLDKKQLAQDFYTSELEFQANCNQQSQAHREVGNQCFKLLQGISKLEANKLKAVQKAFRVYLIKYKERFGSLQNVSTNIVIQYLEALNCQEESLDVYSVENILETKHTEYLKEQLNIKQISFQNLQTFLQDFDIREEKNSPLILQQFKIQRNQGVLLNNFIDCKVILTVDKFMLIFDCLVENNKKLFKKIDFSIDLNTAKIEQKKDIETCVDVISKSDKHMFSTTTKVQLKFNTIEDISLLRNLIQIQEVAI